MDERLHPHTLALKLCPCGRSFLAPDFSSCLTLRWSKSAASTHVWCVLKMFVRASSRLLKSPSPLSPMDASCCHKYFHASQRIPLTCLFATSSSPSTLRSAKNIKSLFGRTLPASSVLIILVSRSQYGLIRRHTAQWVKCSVHPHPNLHFPSPPKRVFVGSAL